MSPPDTTARAKGSTNLVAGHRPATLGHQLARLLVNGRLSSSNLINGKVLKRSRLLNVLERLLQILQLQIDLVLGSLGVLDGLDFESVNGLELTAHVVGGGLEGGEALLDLVNDGLVLEKGAVVAEVNRLGLLGKDLDLAARIVVALLEGLEARGSLATEAEGGADFSPVELERGGSLGTGRRN
jgi:hypothetical protein